MASGGLGRTAPQASDGVGPRPLARWSGSPRPQKGANEAATYFDVETSTPSGVTQMSALMRMAVGRRRYPSCGHAPARIERPKRFQDLVHPRRRAAEHALVVGHEQGHLVLQPVEEEPQLLFVPNASSPNHLGRMGEAGVIRRACLGSGSVSGSHVLAARPRGERAAYGRESRMSFPFTVTW